MKKAILKQLRDVASKLEITYEKSIQTVSGQQLIETGNSVFDGQEINPDMFYQVELQVPANHYKKLKAAYNYGGIKACNQYISDVNETVRRANAAQLSIAAGMNDNKQNFSI